MTDKIQLLNPDLAKKGAVVDRQKYEVVKDAIIHIIDERGKMTFKELMNEVVNQLSNQFEGSPSWYCTAVKLDLEARNIVKRVNTSSPQILTLSDGMKD